MTLAINSELADDFFPNRSDVLIATPNNLFKKKVNGYIQRTGRIQDDWQSWITGPIRYRNRRTIYYH